MSSQPVLIPQGILHKMCRESCACLACRPAPDAPESPADLFAERAAAAALSEAALPLGADPTSAGDRWALARLAASGEEAEGRCALPQYLLLARTLLLPPLGAAVNVCCPVDTVLSA